MTLEEAAAAVLLENAKWAELRSMPFVARERREHAERVLKGEPLNLELRLAAKAKLEGRPYRTCT